MPRRNIGRPRPNFRGVVQRFAHVPIPSDGVAGTFIFLKTTDNGELWLIPEGAFIRNVWALGSGTNGAAGGKAGAGAGGDGGTLAKISNYLAVPLSLINFHVGSAGEDSWFGGTIDASDAPLIGSVFGGVSVGSVITAGDANVVSQGGRAGGSFDGVSWTQTSNSEFAEPGDTQITIGANGNAYGGGAGGGAGGGGPGGVGADGIIVIDLVV